MSEETNKISMGKVYEKWQITKHNSDNLVVCNAFNTETKRRQFVLCYKDDDRLVPIAHLLTSSDLDNLLFEQKVSAVTQTVFEEYESVDNRKTMKEFDGYFDKDKDYQKMLALWDKLRESVE